MKKWENPSLVNLGIKLTNTESDYITICNWDEVINYGLGNEEYKDQNNKPVKHPDWIWCKVHGRWHPKDHTSEIAKS